MQKGRKHGGRLGVLVAGIVLWLVVSPAVASAATDSGPVVTWDDHVTVNIGPNLHGLTTIDARDFETTMIEWGATAVFNTQVIGSPTIPALPGEAVHLAVNPPADGGPKCTNDLGVGPTTRPFTAVSANADGTCTSTPLEGDTVDGTHLAAGTGALTSLLAQYTSSVNVDRAGDVTFHIRSTGPWALSIGPTAGNTAADPTRVQGPFEGRGRLPGATPLLAARSVSGASSRVDAVVVRFPAAGAYFLELDASPSAAAAQSLVLDSGSAAAAKETFASSLRSPSDISNEVKHVATNVALAGALGVLVFFPSELFDSTLEEHYDEITGWWRRRRDQRGARPERRTLVFAGVILIASALYCLLDPSAGFDRHTAVLFAGMLAGLLVVTLVFALPSMLVMRVRHHDSGSLYALPAGVLVAAGCVGLSRLVHFQPGYVYGIVIGFAFATDLSEAEEARTVVIGTAWALVLSAAAWVGHGALVTRASAPGAGLGVEIADAALSVVFVAGLEGVVISLLPLRRMAGGKLRAWSTGIWLALFALSLFAFVHILLNPASGYIGTGDRPSVVSAGAVAAGFALVSVGFWAWFKMKDGRKAGRAAPE